MMIVMVESMKEQQKGVKEKSVMMDCVYLIAEMMDVLLMMHFVPILFVYLGVS
jgi:hypothetical protein